MTPSIRHIYWNAPFIIFLIFLPFSASADLAISRKFLCKSGTFCAPAWCWSVYRYGLYPGQILFLGSLCTAIVARLRGNSLLALRAGYVSCVLIIGSGIITHGVIKQFWQRPRPKQIALFGAKYPFVPVYKPYIGKADRHLRSLPSGHATMGFYFLSLFFLGRRTRKNALAILGLIITCLLSLVISWARLAQGGHFISDILAAGVVMWTTAYWLNMFFAAKEKHATDTTQCALWQRSP